MKVYIDTNVIVADAIADHKHKANATSLFEEIQARRWTPIISSHGLAEVYSNPYGSAISPAKAWQIIEENVLAFFETEPLTRSDFTKILRESAAVGWSGGRVYDAIHVHAARKAKCDRIYTSNPQDFRQPAPDLVDRIMAP